MSTPKNGFGQGAVNNSIGYGQGPKNSSNGWGEIHYRTFGHPNTNLTGEGGFPTDNLDWSSFLPEYTSASVNSGSGVNMVVVNGDHIAYSDLTGVTVVSQEGTANIQVVGNDLVPQNNGDLFGYELSNGVKWNGLWGNVNDSTAYDSNGGENGSINGATILIGRSEGEQLYNWGYNPYDYFKGAEYYEKLNSPFDSGNNEVEFLITGAVNGFGYLIASGVSSGVSSSSPIGVWYNVSSEKIYIRDGGLNLWEQTNTTEIGSVVKVIMTYVSDTQVNYIIDINGINILNQTFTHTIAYNSGLNKWYIGANNNGYLMGLLLNTSLTNYTKVGAFTQSNITGSIQESSTDIFGQPISRPAVGSVDNAPSYSNHYRQIETLANDIFDTSGDYSIMHWFRIPEGADGGYSVTNGRLITRVDATNIYFSRDGGITEIIHAHNASAFVFAAWISATNGDTDLWIGDKDNNPVQVETALPAGVAAAGTQVMQMDNNHALSGRFNGYNAVAGGFPELSAPDKILEVKNFTQGGIPASGGFTYTFPIPLT